MDKLRVGIVGVGEAAQILHLPSLSQLDDLFEVTALCDVSRTVLDGVGRRWGVEARMTDYLELVARANVDVVLIANPSSYHYEVTMAAIKAGKHVLVEKPMCYSPDEADRITEAADSASVTVQVGYMRRYAPTFLEGCRLVREMETVRFARVHDVIGSNAQIIAPTSRVIRGTDISDELKQAGYRHDAEATAAAIGEVPQELSTAYHIMLGLSSHDLSAMREIIGAPRRVLNATQRSGGRTMTATLDYGEFVCLFETSLDEIARFDATIEVYGNQRAVRVDWNTPYVRNLQTLLTVTEANGRHATTTSTHADWGDNFTHEWRALHENVTQKKKPKSSPADYRKDLEIFLGMMEHLKRE